MQCAVMQRAARTWSPLQVSAKQINAHLYSIPCGLKRLRSMVTAPFKSRNQLHTQTVECSATAEQQTIAQVVAPEPVSRQHTSEPVYRGAEALQLVDIGANLTSNAFDKDRTEVLVRAKRAGVEAIVVTGSCIKSVRAAQDLITAYPTEQLYFTAGLHPHNAKQCTRETIQELQQVLAHPRCVAVGECGLDYYRNFSPPAVQEVWFDAQVSLACDIKKPLFLHCRDAFGPFTDILRKHQLTAAVVVHCFTGKKSELQALLDLGCHIGITGWVCDDRPDRGGAELTALLRSIPLDRLMIETDCPYLVPRTIKPARRRPRRCEPALLPYVLHHIAQALGLPPEQVARYTTENARKVFGLDLPQP